MLQRSAPYWGAAGIAAVILAIYPVIYAGGGLVPLVLFVLAGFVLVGGTIWNSTAERRWGVLGLGLLGLLLMSASPVVRGINQALAPPGYELPLGTLSTWLGDARAPLWARACLRLYGSWLLASRRSALAFVTVPILGVGIFVVQWVVSLLLGTLLLRGGDAYPLADPVVVYDFFDGGGLYVGNPVYFIVARAVEVVGVLAGAGVEQPLSTSELR